MIGLKYSATKINLHLKLLVDLKTYVKIGPKETCTITVLLSEQSIKLTSYKFHYTHRLRHISAMVKEVSSCSHSQLTQRTTTEQGAEHRGVWNTHP